MQDLTLVGLTADGTKLVLVSDSGEEYTLPADARLRSALRGDHARLGQLEIQMESTLRPRDIQARIRSGETPETVAAAAQTTVEKIMGYATPVLAERAHIADRAQRSSVRRKAGDGPARLLGDAVTERLRGRNVDPDSVEWDAWRRDDGRWTLVADYRSGESARHAEFVYDAPGRYVIPHDDEAKWLVGEQTSSKGPQPRSGGSTRRLSAVSNEEELPLGEDAIGMVSESDPLAEEHTVDLSEASAAVREDRSRPPQVQDLPIETGDADWIATQASERPAAAEQAPDDEVDDEPEQKAAPPKRPTKKTRGRASVPSWDEIMFGGGKSE
jgi:Protein of unknown function (DUF3071)